MTLIITMYSAKAKAPPYPSLLESCHRVALESSSTRFSGNIVGPFMWRRKLHDEALGHLARVMVSNMAHEELSLAPEVHPRTLHLIHLKILKKSRIRSW